MRIKALVLAAAFSIPTIASAQDTKKTDTTATDKSMDKSTEKSTAKLEGDDLKIVAHHNHVNLMEISMGKLAQKRGTAKVKKYGAMLIKDHTAANKQVKALAKKKGVATIPEDVPANDTEKKEHDDAMAAMDRMKTLKGAEFDREFLTMMAADHDKEIARIDTAMAMVKDPDLTTFLRNVRPTLQRHADTARDLQKNTEVSRK